MKTSSHIIASCVLFLSGLTQLQAQIPQLINYQGRVLVGSVNFDGTGQFKFALVNASGSTTYWSNDGTSTNGSEPTNPVSLSVVKGLYSVLLGDVLLANMTAVPASVFNNADVRLRIWFNDGAHGSQLITPDQRIASVGYSMVASNALSLGGVAANQYVLTNDSRLSDARPASSVNFGTATLSGTLPLASGGTGLSSSGANGNFLRSNGSSWTSGGLSAADIPGGSGNYIQNTASQQLASFNISGSGVVGGSFAANTITLSSTTFGLIFAQSSSTTGSWLRLINTSAGGHNWNIISTGSGNAEGAGKLIFNDQTSGLTRMILDGSGAAVTGNLSASGNVTISGNLSVTGALNAPFPNAKARQTSLQTFPNGPVVVVRLDEAQFASGVTFDNANDRLVIVTPGLYQITADLFFVANNTGPRLLAINSTSVGELASVAINAVNGFDSLLYVSVLARLSAGEGISTGGAQNSGGNLNTSPFNGRSATLSVNWVAP